MSDADTTLEGVNIESGQEGSRKEKDKKVNNLCISGFDWLTIYFAQF